MRLLFQERMFSKYDSFFATAVSIVARGLRALHCLFCRSLATALGRDENPEGNREEHVESQCSTTGFSEVW